MPEQAVPRKGAVVQRPVVVPDNQLQLPNQEEQEWWGLSLCPRVALALGQLFCRERVLGHVVAHRRVARKAVCLQLLPRLLKEAQGREQ